ncbi:penicillin acylase family protein [Streptomyces sp. NPDC051940]|uniref:penicillin acylase family protein n=1 Tax=Streptomyces sp. NPDC051940 TaxID=3155675 RepID=UPI00341F27F6
MATDVHRDAWGIPHLRADSADELAWIQGCNAALDRAWQLETERHRSQGTSAAFLGPGSADWDVLARRALLDDTARRCYAALDAATAGWVWAYVAGVNAGLAEGARRAPEFAASGLRPGRWRAWTPLAVWLSHHLLFAGFPAKLWRETATRRLGPDAVGLFAADGPGTAGSNGWLVTGERTASGAPVIAGDPHRFIEDPGVYQQIHLVCPEYDVVGLAVPGVPGVAHFGHTGGVAWAITNAMADYQDLYEERLRRRGAGRVEALGPDGWQPVRTRTTTVEVAGAQAIEVEVIETGRGPIVAGGPDAGPDAGPKTGPDAGPGSEPAEGHALSLRTPARVWEDLGFAALPALLRARTVADVDRALDGWTEPVNVVLAADTAGGLLHRVAGRVPRRHTDNRKGVVAAWDTAYAWGPEPEPMPRTTITGPTAVMANERGISSPFGVEFAPPHRADRIGALLAQSAEWTPEAMASVHTDTYLASATPLLDLLAAPHDGPTPVPPHDGLTPQAAALRDRLLAWDRRMAADSTDATAFAALRAAVVRRLAAHPALAPLTEPTPYPAVFAPWLALLPRVAYALEHLLRDRTLDVDRPALVRDALEEAARAGAPRPWGEVHRLAPWQALPGESDSWPGTGGDHDCVLATSSVPGLTDRFARGSAARYVWDLADRSRSLWAVPLGAVGIPGHPHHRDQLPRWAAGELIPVVTDFTRLTKEPDDQPRP